MLKALSPLRRMALPLLGQQQARLLALNTGRVLPFLGSWSVSTKTTKTTKTTPLWTEVVELPKGENWVEFLEWRALSDLGGGWSSEFDGFPEHSNWLVPGFKTMSHLEAREGYLEVSHHYICEHVEQDILSPLRDPKRNEARRQAEDAMWEAGRECRELWLHQFERYEGGSTLETLFELRDVSLEDDEKSRAAWSEWVKVIEAWKDEGGDEAWVNDWEGEEEMFDAKLEEASKFALKAEYEKWGAEAVQKKLAK